ncbi:hypothetical protein ACHAWF_003093, partial [Thalassiosira exigua]
DGDAERIVIVGPGPRPGPPPRGQGQAVAAPLPPPPPASGGGRGGGGGGGGGGGPDPPRGAPGRVPLERRRRRRPLVRSTLAELRDRAVRKLDERRSLDVKVAGSSGRNFADLAEGDFAGLGWGREVSIVAGAPRDGGSSSSLSPSSSSSPSTLALRIVDVDPSLTAARLASDLRRVLDARSVRVVRGGRDLSASSPDASLLRAVAASEAGGRGGGSGGDRGGGGDEASGKKKGGALLCLVSGRGGASSASSASARTDASAAVASVRRAALALQRSSSGGSRFEVTDQDGNLVPMSERDSASLLAALGLHRLGRSRMGDGGGDGGDGEGGGGPDVASALAFLLEADAEWDDAPALDAWRSKVDNYGLLQLDVAWCYLLLESMDHLADAARRLDVAESVLRKQVHSNFVTLALASAEADRPVPPLCAVFVRLFLLQGVASALRGDRPSASERLGRARLLCRALRSRSPPDAASHLRDAYRVPRSAAIAALRRCDGDPDAAGRRIEDDREEERRAARKRRRQRRAGRCANGTDFADVDLAPSLAGMLGFADGAVDFGDEFDGEDADDPPRDLSTSAAIVVALLRLSDNDVERSLRLYRDLGAEGALARAAAMDEASGRRRRRPTRRPPEREVRDLDVTTLVSMGADEGRARDALRATGDVEAALLWLSANDAGADVGAAEGGATGEDGGGDGSEHHRGSEDDSDDASSDSEDDAVYDAQEILERELGNALGAGSKELLEREWLGVDLQEEWDLIEKYTRGT